jgi:membrane peptidoglycan carboxypeptidase
MTEALTSRMKWIVKRMRENDAVIQEHRDTFLERSWYELTWGEHLEHSHRVTRPMLRKLKKASLIEIKENKPIYKYGEFITSESVFGLVEATE